MPVANNAIPEVRIRSKIDPSEMQSKVGKILTDNDYSLLATNDVRVLKPNGELLLVYRKNWVPEAMRQLAYPILTTIRAMSNNRGAAAGSPRVMVRGTAYSKPVMSNIIGYFDPYAARFPYCRLTAWTGRHTEEFSALYPYFQTIAEGFRESVPDRFKVQMGVTA
jgi:hypothetical protein